MKELNLRMEYSYGVTSRFECERGGDWWNFRLGDNLQIDEGGVSPYGYGIRSLDDDELDEEDRESTQPMKEDSFL